MSLSIPEIPVAEARDRLASPHPPRLIDVREQDEWDTARIPGAELLPLSQWPAIAQQHLTDPRQPLLIHCHHGMRSANATEFLLRSGFTDVTNLAGGIDAPGPRRSTRSSRGIEMWRELMAWHEQAEAPASWFKC